MRRKRIAVERYQARRQSRNGSFELPLRLLFDEKCRLSFCRHLRQLIVVSAAFAGLIRIKFEIHRTAALLQDNGNQISAVLETRDH